MAGRLAHGQQPIQGLKDTRKIQYPRTNKKLHTFREINNILQLTDGSGNSELSVDPPGSPVDDGAAEALNSLLLVLFFGEYVSKKGLKNLKKYCPYRSVWLVRIHDSHRPPPPHQDRLRVPQPGGVEGVAADEAANGGGAALQGLKRGRKRKCLANSHKLFSPPDFLSPIFAKVHSFEQAICEATLVEILPGEGYESPKETG